MHTTSTTLLQRQVWNRVTTSASLATQYCTSITLPASGVISFATDNVVTLTQSVVYQPVCTSTLVETEIDGVDLTQPFYASATPQVYVVAAATVLAWVLVIMLVISPRTYLHSLGTSGLSAGRGIISGAQSGTTSSVGVGSRPWLQKAATLTVAISLTMATAHTFEVTARHYPATIDGNSLRELVENSIEIRVTRIISDIFVWLAQVQTLIRLFPRHKEKVLIKWIGFALIVLDTIFSCLNSFLLDDDTGPRVFADAIPALSYLFELSLSLLYSAWVIYYSFTKRQYAFYHPKMRSISLIANLALISIMTPVVFFITDITLPNSAGWGDYFRWAGGAAASVVVWEWVERIEILERDEKKDGILGRELFEGDDMLETYPTGAMTYNPRRKGDYFLSGSMSGGSTNTDSPGGGPPRKITFRLPRRSARNADADLPEAPLDFTQTESSSSDPQKPTQEQQPASGLRATIQTRLRQPLRHISLPSRNDTTSAASTLYVVHHRTTGAAQPVRQPSRLRTSGQQSGNKDTTTQEHSTRDLRAFTSSWQNVPNPFKRKRTTPPAEVRAAMTASGQDPTSRAQQLAIPSKDAFDFRSKIAGIASRSGLRDKQTSSFEEAPIELPWTIIPAQPRGTTWSPGPLGNPDTAADGAADTTQASDATSTVVDPASSGKTSVETDASRGEADRPADVVSDRGGSDGQSDPG